MDRYLRLRDAPDGNALMEEPYVLAMLNDVTDKRVLDLGCGDARLGDRLLSADCASYTGIDASEEMVTRARSRLGSTHLVCCALEEFAPPPGAYDVVVAQMSLHYVADLASIFRAVRRALRDPGMFVFSVEHPVITSCYDSAVADDVPERWVVASYFDRGPRVVRWLGELSIKYHRPVEDYLKHLAEADFQTVAMKEGEPTTEVDLPDVLLRVRRSVPQYLIVGARTAS
ncbi:MAG TPA: class I SAM-dependent methyltransferase [Thermoleophilaceae bacterium]|nr:class I SAM-dependent methyltransferase [Thermoleophilaceae bacterium]